MTDWWICCPHCECEENDRIGHDDTCRYGCNDQELVAQGFLNPMEEVDLCEILGHDFYKDESNHCGRCDLWT